MSSRASSGSTQSDSIIGKCFATLFAGAFLLFGLVIFFLLARGIFADVHLFLWKSTPCQIVESRWNEAGVEGATGSPDERFVLTIRYRYQFENRSFTGERYSAHGNGFTDAGKIQRTADRYRTGTSSTCWVNPGNPREAVLYRNAKMLLAAPFLVIPLLFAWAGLFMIRKIWGPVQPTPSEQPLSTRASANAGRLGAKLFAWGFFLVGAALAIPLVIMPVWLVISAQFWPTVPCQILSSTVMEHPGSDNATYSVEITYSYRIAGRNYVGNRYDFMGGASSGRAGKEEVIRHYPQGAERVCFVNPKDPTDAVIYRGLDWTVLFGLIPLVFIVIGGFGLIAIRRPRQPVVPLATRTSAAPQISVSAPLLPSMGGVELRPKTPPLMKFLGLLAFAIIWNGFISIFVYLIARDWSQGKHMWFAAIFISIFVLIGLLLIIAVISSFLALFNPRIRLTAASDAVPLGGKLDLRWRFDGSVGRIRRLWIELEGREEARYRRGTTTSTDKHVFARIPVMDTEDVHMIHEGHATPQIPATLMHTFTADNNKIIWTLKLKGEIPKYPDVDEEFAITILPRT